MQDTELLERVRQGLGSPPRDRAAAILRVALYTLAQAASVRLIERMARDLPPHAAATVRAAQDHRRPPEGLDLAHEIAQHGQLAVGRSREAAEVVCALIGETLSEETATIASRELPPSIVELLFPRSSRPESRPVAHHLRATGGTLSSGRPGSARQLALSKPVGPAAHEHRLSASRGTRQEAAGETLATSAPRRRSSTARRPR